MDIFTIIITILFVIAGFLASYFKTKTKLLSKVAEIIAEAEVVYKDFTKYGGVKFNYCVDFLYGLVPKILRCIITRPIIEKLVQNTFDSIIAFIEKELDKKID